jgi:hypothetical protein
MMPATLDTALTRTLQQRFAERVALDEPMSGIPRGTSVGPRKFSLSRGIVQISPTSSVRCR